MDMCMESSKHTITIQQTIWLRNISITGAKDVEGYDINAVSGVGCS
jgi:hypothetical protein